MKKLSSPFVSFAGQKLIIQHFNLLDIDNTSLSDLCNFPELVSAFCLGVRFREEFSKSPLKVKKKICSDYLISDIYSEYLKSFKSFFK